MLASAKIKRLKKYCIYPIYVYILYKNENFKLILKIDYSWT